MMTNWGTSRCIMHVEDILIALSISKFKSVGTSTFEFTINRFPKDMFADER